MGVEGLLNNILAFQWMHTAYKAYASVLCTKLTSTSQFLSIIKNLIFGFVSF